MYTQLSVPNDTVPITLQCRTLTMWCCNFNMGSVVPNRVLFFVALTGSDDFLPLDSYFFVFYYFFNLELQTSVKDSKKTFYYATLNAHHY